MPSDNSNTDAPYQLVESYEDNFSKWSANNSLLSPDQIAAFTIADEPAWNKMIMQDLATVASLVEISEAIHDLEIPDDVD